MSETETTYHVASKLGYVSDFSPYAKFRNGWYFVKDIEQSMEFSRQGAIGCAESLRRKFPNQNVMPVMLTVTRRILMVHVKPSK